MLMLWLLQVREWPLYGCSLFAVRFDGDHRVFPESVVIGVNEEGLMVLSESLEDVLAVFP